MRAFVMTSFEWLAVIYFSALAAAAIWRGGGRRAVAYACGAAALVIVARFALPWTLRVWLPHAYLVLGYWIPADIAPPPDTRFEAWLARTLNFQLPTANSQLLELAYLGCYPMISAAFFIVYRFGSTPQIEQFWLSVLSAGYACYLTLVWKSARPPRLVTQADDRPQPRGLAALNVQVLGRVSHQLVTFPSGHVAVSFAAAMAVAEVWPEAAAAFAVIALLIGIAAVAGRYHYIIDVVLGLIAGLAVPLLTRSL